MFQTTYAYSILKRKQSESAKINANQAGILYRNYVKGKLNNKNNGYNITIFGRKLFSIKRNPGL